MSWSESSGSVMRTNKCAKHAMQFAKSDRSAPSIAMAAKSFERIVLSRARSAAFGSQGPLTKQSFRNTRRSLRSTAFSDRQIYWERTVSPPHPPLPLAQINRAHPLVGGDLGRRAFGEHAAADHDDDARGEAEHQLH